MAFRTAHRQGPFDPDDDVVTGFRSLSVTTSIPSQDYCHSYEHAQLSCLKSIFISSFEWVRVCLVGTYCHSYEHAQPSCLKSIFISSFVWVRVYLVGTYCHSYEHAQPSCLKSIFISSFVWVRVCLVGTYFF